MFDLESEESIKAAVDGLDLWGVVNCAGFGGEIASPQDTGPIVFLLSEAAAMTSGVSLPMDGGYTGR